MGLTLRCHVEPKIARPSSSYVQASGYVLLGSCITLAPASRRCPSRRLLPGGVME
jgi:hypothetical protein